MKKLIQPLVDHFLVNYRLFRHLMGIERCPFQAITMQKENYFFDNGWGDEKVLKELAEHSLLTGPLEPIEIEWHQEEMLNGGVVSKNGTFKSPMPTPLLAAEASTAHVKLFLPRNSNQNTPIVVVFAMTGDEGFEFRYRTISRGLAKKGIATLLLENPYYGVRKPKTQRNYRLQTVQEMLSMSVTTVREGRALVDYLHRQGHTSIGVSGVSQGAMVAALVASLSGKELSVACSLIAHSPDEVLVRGLLSCFVNWRILCKSMSIDEATDRITTLFSSGNIILHAPPKQLDRVFILGAKSDAVTPIASLRKIEAHWKGAKVRQIPGTHVTSILMHSRSFRRLIADSVRWPSL